MKKFINKLFGILGYAIKRKKYIYEPKENLVKTINHFKIKSVIDVGANTGQFAEQILKNNFSGKIISFEPLYDEYKVLQSKTKNKRYKNWELEERCALGNKETKQKIFISGNSESSSLLEILPKHTDIRPLSKVISSHNVKVKKLDSFYNKLKKTLRKKTLLKIDTQGYELAVLKGSKKTLNLVDFILVEVSLVNLYKKQKLWLEVIGFLRNQNFEVWSVDRVMGNYKTGQTYQLDILFYKNKIR